MPTFPKNERGEFQEPLMADHDGDGASDRAPDGTPLADLQEELRELKAELAGAKKRLRTIVNMCTTPHWNAERRWKVRDIAEGKTT
jgi:hypothetical protein